MSRQAIDAANAAFVANLNRGDAAAAGAVYTDDAKILPPGHPTIEGRDAITEFWVAGIQQMGITGVTLRTVELEIVAGTAYEVGSYTLSGSTGPLGEGKYIVVWKRGSDGAWRWHRDIWNSNES